MSVALSVPDRGLSNSSVVARSRQFYGKKRDPDANGREPFGFFLFLRLSRIIHGKDVFVPLPLSLSSSLSFSLSLFLYLPLFLSFSRTGARQDFDDRESLSTRSRPRSRRINERSASCLLVDVLLDSIKFVERRARAFVFRRERLRRRRRRCRQRRRRRF